jgi:alpha-beta hydrolase superfamily lysophospholipase
MKHSEDRFSGVGEHSIYFQFWEPEVAIKAVVLLAHGAGEHGGRYQQLAQYFTGYGYAVAALDHQGHGNSDGSPGYVDSFDDYLEDLAIFHRQISDRFAGVPMFLLGHSMGGLVASLYLLRHQGGFLGGILSGAAIKTDLAPGKVQLWLLRLVAVLVPRLGILKLNPEGVSRDPEVVRQYIEDPLVFHGKMSARMARELFAGMDAIQAGAGGITLPMLILHGGADVMTSPEGSRFLYDHIRSIDKTLHMYPGLYHEIFNEPERAQVMAQVLDWCDARLSAN